MLDAMVPSLKAMKDAATEGKSVREALEAGVRAAWAGATYQRSGSYQRPSQLCEKRGLGHQDPEPPLIPICWKSLQGWYRDRYRKPVPDTKSGIEQRCPAERNSSTYGRICDCVPQ